MPQRQCKTKIVATLGPASSSEALIRRLLRAGVDVFRLNFSHGSHVEQRRRITAIRKVANSVGCTCAVLADLQGPKIRTGPTAGEQPVRLRKGGASG